MGKIYRGLTTQLFRLVLGVILLGVSLSCQKPAKAPSDRIEVEADQWIDRGEFSKAIELLNRELTARTYKDQKQKEAWTLTLASAYLGRAGLSIDQFYELAESFQDQRRRGEPFLKVPFEKLVENLQSEDSKEALDAALFLERVYFVLELVDNLILRFEKIPFIESSSAEDLNRALSLLRKEDLEQKGSHLFKALIETVSIKSRWKFGEYKFDGASQFSSACDLNIDPFLTQLKGFASDVKVVFEDISRVFPEEVKKLSDFEKALNGVQNLDASELNSKSEELSSGLFILLMQFSPKTLQELKCI